MNKKIKFRVQSHILKLLGDELIGQDRLAVFELVKNAYDADAKEVSVTLDLKAAHPKITVLDDGDGMSASTIEHGWLEIGTNSKRGEINRHRSNTFGRMPLGEKGVGRLATQKLGKSLRVITRAKQQPEYEFSINWTDLLGNSQFLDDDLGVLVSTNLKPKLFEHGTGTAVEISDLYRSEWTRREIRDLYRLVTSLSNPFDEVESFKTILDLRENSEVIADLPTVKDMLDASVWQFDFELNINGILAWRYKFKPPKFKGLVPRNSNGEGKLELVPSDADDDNSAHHENDQIFLSPQKLKGIGPIKGRVYAFHRRSEILKESGSLQQIKDWLDSQTGVRVYRDRVRVFNYGEPGDDWLGLNARRINSPTGKLGTNSVIAHIDLDLESSNSLKEKTNREGFDENIAFRRLQRIVLSIFRKLEREHAADREAIDKALKGDETVPAIKQAMEALDSIAKEHKLEKDMKPLIKSIQQELDGFRDLMVSSGMAGMNLALVFHEVVHSINNIRSRLDLQTYSSDLATIRGEVDHLRKLLDTFKPLLQRERVRKLPARELIQRTLNIHEDRFARHGVVISNWTTEGEKSVSFPITGPLNLLVGAVSNIIDNAIYWTRYRQQLQESTIGGAILVLSDWNEESGGMIAIVDNGPGFQLPPDQLGTPFHSTRAEGMGLGLYYCKLVMESIGGSLEAIDASSLRDHIDIPLIYDGAALILHFARGK